MSKRDRARPKIRSIIDAEERVMHWFAGAINDCMDRRGPVEIGPDELREVYEDVLMLLARRPSPTPENPRGKGE